jgi:hypothetical protein
MFQIVVPENNGYTAETLRQRAVPHLEQLGITSSIGDDLRLTYGDTARAAIAIGNTVLEKHYGVTVFPILTENEDGFEYDPDCPACLRHLPHTAEERQAALRRNYAASLPDYPDDVEDTCYNSF